MKEVRTKVMVKLPVLIEILDASYETRGREVRRYRFAVQVAGGYYPFNPVCERGYRTPEAAERGARKALKEWSRKQIQK